MKYFATVLFLTMMVRVGTAQSVVFTSADFLQMIAKAQTEDNFTSTDVSGLSTLITTKGANVSWDIGSRTYTKSTTGSSFPNLQTITSAIPFATDPDFYAATHYEQKNITGATEYSFFTVSTDGLFFLGAADDSTNGKQGKVMVLTPPAQFAKFPMSIGTTWTSTSTITGSATKGQQGAKWQESGNCDAWGTLTTPTSAGKKNQIAATEQALRVKQVQQFGATIQGTFYGVSNYDTKFYGTGTHSVDITTDANDVPSKISYTAPAGSNDVSNPDSYTFTASISPNPVSGTQAKITFAVGHDCKAEFSLIDALGQQVQRSGNMNATAGENIIPIDASTLASGTYFIRVNAAGMTTIRKLIVTK